MADDQVLEDLKRTTESIPDVSEIETIEKRLDELPDPLQSMQEIVDDYKMRFYALVAKRAARKRDEQIAQITAELQTPKST